MSRKVKHRTHGATYKGRPWRSTTRFRLISTEFVLAEKGWGLNLFEPDFSQMKGTIRNFEI